jgi:hypothetical protein
MRVKTSRISGLLSSDRLLMAVLMGLAAAGCGGGSDGGSQPPTPPGQSGTGGRGGSPGNTGTGGNSGVATPGGFASGRVTMRRLNSIEYDNTIRDLLGVDLAQAARPSVKFQFPADEWGDGFFNDGDVLSSSPLTVEKFLSAAQYAVDLALDPAPTNPARARIVTCDFAGAAEAACLPKIVGEFARRAFRRPVATDELGPYLGLVDVAKGKGSSAEVGLKLALSAILVAPDFLFRMEIDPSPGQTRQLNDFELASRLSYFIWASMPDEELFTRAKEGVLGKPEEIAKQVKRLLGDGRSSSFSAAMSEQWMLTMALAFAKPEKATFPTWDDSLRDAMAGEVKAFLTPVLSGQVSAEDLVTGKYVYANRALGTFYGLPGAASLPVDRFEKVAVTDGRRGGVLRQGSFLVHTSHPDSHSPTIRGKFILDRLLCVKVPLPPANVPLFIPGAEATGTLRQKLTKLHHGMGGSCAACHALIDPMGFALENYDGAGLWRDKDNNLPVDATGTMPGTGVPFNGAEELSQAIAKDERFAACMAKQVLTYATGRHLGDGDRPLIEDLGKKFAAGGMKFPALVELVATSPAMTHRLAE